MRYILTLGLLAAFLPSIAQDITGTPKPKELKFTLGLYRTVFNEHKVATNDPYVYNDVPDYTKGAPALQIGLLKQMKGNHYLEANLRLKITKFYVRYDYLIYPQGSAVPTFNYSTYSTPAFDLSLAYAHKFSYKRFYALPKAGFVLYMEPQKGDTSVYERGIDQENSWGYRGKSPFRLGYTAGVSLNYKISRRFDIGIDAVYNGTFSNKYDYYFKMRQPTLSHFPENAWGIKLQNLYTGFNIKMNLGKRKK